MCARVQAGGAICAPILTCTETGMNFVVNAIRDAVLRVMSHMVQDGLAGATPLLVAPHCLSMRPEALLYALSRWSPGRLPHLPTSTARATGP